MILKIQVILPLLISVLVRQEVLKPRLAFVLTVLVSLLALRINHS